MSVYCFDEYRKCDGKFATDKCYKFINDNNCYKQESLCKFKEKEKRCCLILMCGHDYHKEKENNENKKYENSPGMKGDQKKKNTQEVGKVGNKKTKMEKKKI